VNSHYALGVTLAILCGVVSQTGILLEKSAVNRIPQKDREERFMRTLLKNPVWLTGLIMKLVLGSALFLIAQGLIGPALVPGLMASGLIVLAVGSVKLIGESLSRKEVSGILLMIVGILLLGLSELKAGAEVVREALELPGIAGRIAIFSATLFFLWGGIHWVSLRSPKRKGIIMAFSNGCPYALSNFWVSPLIAVAFRVLGGSGSWGEIGLFALASVILVGTTAFGIRQTQEAFKFAQASNVVPVQQVLVQIAPILVYFYVFSLEPAAALSGALILAGVSLIIVSGFLLGSRQTELERIR
jgi:hypothetical protein